MSRRSHVDALHVMCEGTSYFRCVSSMLVLLVCFLLWLAWLFFFRPDMLWHAVWLPFNLGIQSQCVCLCACHSCLYSHTQCVFAKCSTYSAGRYYKASCENVCFGLPCVPFFLVPLSMLYSPPKNTHTPTHTLSITVSDGAFLGSLSHCRSDMFMQCACMHQLVHWR